MRKQVGADTVLEYLDNTDRGTFEGPARWDELCLIAGALIERRIADVLLLPQMSRAAVFTTGDVATFADVSTSSANRALAMLAARGLITPVVRGIWARREHPSFSPYAVVPFLLGASVRSLGRCATAGYVSLLSALNLHGLIDPIPRTVQIVVDSQRPTLTTLVGTFSFHQLQPALVTGYAPGGRLANFDLATPAKALFDVLYLSTRRGRRFAHLPELDRSRDVHDAEMQRCVSLIRSPSIRAAAKARWEKMRPHVEHTKR